MTVDRLAVLLSSMRWLVGIGVVAGCYDVSVQEPVGPDSGSDAATDADADTDTDADTDYDTVFDGDTEQCDLLFGEYTGDPPTAYYHEVGNSVEIFQGVWLGDVWESLALAELVGAQAGDQADLSGQSQYELCNYCLLVFLDCPADQLANCSKSFIATAGTMKVIDIDSAQPAGHPVEFVATDVVVEECTITWGDYHSELVPDGETICVGAWHVVVIPE